MCKTIKDKGEPKIEIDTKTKIERKPRASGNNDNDNDNDSDKASDAHANSAHKRKRRKMKSTVKGQAVDSHQNTGKGKERDHKAKETAREDRAVNQSENRTKCGIRRRLRFNANCSDGHKQVQKRTEDVAKGKEGSHSKKDIGAPAASSSNGSAASPIDVDLESIDTEHKREGKGKGRGRGKENDEKGTRLSAKIEGEEGVRKESLKRKRETLPEVQCGARDFETSKSKRSDFLSLIVFSDDDNSEDGYKDMAPSPRY